MLDKNAIAGRLREFGEAKFGKIKDFAEYIGMAPAALQSGYLNGRSIPGPEMLVKLKKAGCDINWLLTGEESIKAVEVPVRELKLVGTIPAGHGEINSIDVLGYEVPGFDPDNCELLQIDAQNGHSMMPIIKEGDWVVVSYKEPVTNGCMVAARWGKNKGAIKILTFNKDIPEYCFLRSANPAEEVIGLKRKEVTLYRVIGWIDRGKRK